MHSKILIVARPGRLPRIEAVGGLAVRCTEPDTVHLVSAAATPLGGDSISIRVIVEEHARLRLRSVAATMVLPGATSVESAAEWDLQVAGEVDLDPEPTVIAGGSSHVAVTRLRIEGQARVRLRERVQIGRTGESHGFWSGVMHADRDAVPLLRHRIELGEVADDELAAPRAYASELRYPDSDFDRDFDAAGDDDRYGSRRNHVVLALAGGGCLATWQGRRL